MLDLNESVLLLVTLLVRQRGGSLDRFVALALREGWHVTVDTE